MGDLVTGDSASHGQGGATPPGAHHRTNRYVFAEDAYEQARKDYLTTEERRTFAEAYPLYAATLMALHRSIGLLGLEDIVVLPDDLEQKIRRKGYRLSSDGSGISHLSLREKSIIVLHIMEAAHDALAMRHPEKALAFRDERAAYYMPFVLSGEAGFERFLNDSFTDTYKKLGLQDALEPLVRYGPPAPLCRDMFFLARDEYIDAMGLRHMRDLARFARQYFTRHYGAAAPSAARTVSESPDLTKAFARAIIRRNDGRLDAWAETASSDTTSRWQAEQEWLRAILSARSGEQNPEALDHVAGRHLLKVFQGTTGTIHEAETRSIWSRKGGRPKTGGRRLRVLQADDDYCLRILLLNYRGEPLTFMNAYERLFADLAEAATAIRDLGPYMAARLLGMRDFKDHLESRMIRITLSKDAEKVAQRQYDFRGMSEFNAIMASLSNLGYAEEVAVATEICRRDYGLGTVPIVESNALGWLVDYEGRSKVEAHDHMRIALIQPVTELSSEHDAIWEIDPDENRYMDYQDRRTAWLLQYGILQSARFMSDVIHRKEGLLPFPSLSDLARDAGVSAENLAQEINVSVAQAQA